MKHSIQTARVVALAMTFLATQRAEAQFCPIVDIPRNSCDERNHRDPVNTARGASYYRQRDVTLRLPVGTFVLDRYFISNSSAWSEWDEGGALTTADLRGPYGKGLSGSGLRWWHGLHALVYKPAGASPLNLWLRDMSGAVSEFGGQCPDGGIPCWLPHSSAALAVPGHLRRDIDGGYHLTRDDGETLSYTAGRPRPNGDPPLEIYLSGGTTSAGQQLFTVHYFEESDAGVIPGCQSAHRGVPYIKSVSFGPSSPAELRFSYAFHQLPDAGSPQCLLQRIEHWETSSGPPEALVSYAYDLFANQIDQSSMPQSYYELSGVFGPDGGLREPYAYGTPTNPLFQRLAGPSTPAVTHALSSAGTYFVASSVGGGPSRTSVTMIPWVSGDGYVYCPPDTCCVGSSATSRTEIVEAFQDGGIGMKSTFFHAKLPSSFTKDIQLFRRTDSSTAGPAENVSEGTVEWHRLSLAGNNACSYTEPSEVWAVKNKLGYFSVTPRRWSVPTTGPVTTKVLELAGELKGATSADGGGALESVDYTYAYGPREDKHLETSSRVSLIQNGGVATTTYKYDLSTSRLTAVVESGWTQNFDAGVPEQKHRATFYKLLRECDFDGTADSYGRALRIEGPCFVDSPTATGCSGEFPVTEFTYFSATTTGANRAGRLRLVKRYPNNATGSCGTALTTEYTSYSTTGLPTGVIDESNASSSYEYSGDKLIRKTQVVTGDTRETTFSYEGDKLVKVTHPRLNSELFCYRDGPGDTCTGTPKRQLQWRAKFDSSMTWTEKISYKYWAGDETLESEEHWVNISGPATVRFKKSYLRDAHQRLVLDSVGNTGTLPSTRRAYDGNDNLTRIGSSFAGAHAFCATNPYACAWLTYDRADRQVQLDQFPDAQATTNQMRTCLNYGTNGDLRRVVAGCDGTTSCNNDGGTDSCNAGWTDYETDDFGNVVTIIYPWTHSSTSRGTMRFEYDALGNLTKKKSAEMVNQGYYLLYTRDSLGRLKMLERKNVSGSTVQLFALKYDGTEPVETGCPFSSFGGGRLTAREDSFGVTRYLYDEAGAVTKEVRRRYGLTGCTGDTSQDKNPTTSYEYTKNGELKQIIYPHGRTVNYVYPSSGAMDRPSSISYTAWVSGGWATAATAIDSIRWEPYGGLRSYRLMTGAGAGQWVEYFRGANLETLVGAGTCSSLSVSGPNDQSGRLRGVFVSDGTYLPGSPNGNIFKQVYTWEGEQLVEQATCHRNGGNRVVETFGYDKTGRLTSHNDQVAGTSTFIYNRRDVRVGATVPSPSSCVVGTDTWPAAWQVDMLFDNRWGSTFGTTCSANGKYNYWYDLDGRRTHTWDEYDKFHVTTSFVSAPDGGVSGSGLESVYQSALLAGGNYQSDSYGTGTYGYFYDALGRRRAKTTAWSTTDEYFYDLGHQMLSDKGGNTIGSASTSFPEDDYIWLGGRPVLLVRGQFQASTWSRLAETTSTWCPRNGENFVCGERPIVTDYLGKPVLMLDRGGTAYTANYEAFGYANRHEYRVGSPHYVVGSSNVATIAEPIQSGFDGTLRFLLSRSNYGMFSNVKVNGQTETAPAGDRSHVWTTWRTNGSNTWTIAWNGSSGDYGFDVEAYEMRIKQVGTVWASTPLRFPGQYFDAETELHENWNRYFDPTGGRYLSPEPLLRNPLYVRRMAQNGMSVPTYAYAANNPLRYTDPDGRCVFTGLDTLVCLSAADAALIAAAAVGITAAGATVVANSQSSTKDEPVCGPLTLSQTQEQCRKQHEANYLLCRETLLAQNDAIGTLTASLVCNLCLNSDRNTCMGRPPDPISDAACWMLLGKHGAKFPFL